MKKYKIFSWIEMKIFMKKFLNVIKIRKILIETFPGYLKLVDVSWLSKKMSAKLH